MSIRKVVAGLLITAGIAIMAVPFFWRATGEKQTEQLISEFEQTLEDDYDEETDVEEEQTSISEEDEAILKEGGVSPRRLSGAGAAVGVHLTPDVRIPLLRGDALSRARARVRVRPAAAARLSRHRVCLHGGKRRALRAVFPRAHGRDDPARLCMECAQMAPGLAVLTPGKLQKSRYCL